MANQKSESQSSNGSDAADGISIEVPYAHDLVAVGWSMHVNVRLSADQTNALRRIAEALDRQRATLASGRRITTANDAVRWLLEQVDPQ